MRFAVGLNEGAFVAAAALLVAALVLFLEDGCCWLHKAQILKWLFGRDWWFCMRFVANGALPFLFAREAREDIYLSPPLPSTTSMDNEKPLSGRNRLLQVDFRCVGK
jgi:hypothetical protein